MVRRRERVTESTEASVKDEGLLLDDDDDDDAPATDKTPARYAATSFSTASATA
jgi:hypothetical protein